MTSRLKSVVDRLTSVGIIVASTAKWLWLLPPVRSAALTVVARIGVGSTVTAIAFAIADSLAQR